MAGGKDTKTRHFRLVLVTPSVRTADQLVRLINTRFPGAAQGTEDPGHVNLAVPKEYQDDKLHFLDLIGAIYLRETPDARDSRIKLLADTLASGKDMDRTSLCLEAFGGAVLPHLRPLAEHPSAAVRFYVGRTLAALQDAEAVIILEPIALDDKSEFQEMAVEALGHLKNGVGMGVLGRTLNAKSARVRVAAWQCMARLAPRMFVALFGNITIRPPILAETRRVTATAVAGDKTITVISRSHERDFRIDAPLDVRRFIEAVAAPMDLEKTGKPQGLDLDYSDVVGLLNKMSQRQALSGPIVLQPLKYRVPGDRPTARPIGESDNTDIKVEDLAPPEPKSKK
jgi:hypothetical protein